MNAETRIKKLEVALLHVISAMNKYTIAAEKQLEEDYRNELIAKQAPVEKIEQRYQEIKAIYEMQKEALVKALELVEDDD